MFKLVGERKDRGRSARHGWADFLGWFVLVSRASLELNWFDIFWWESFSSPEKGAIRDTDSYSGKWLKLFDRDSTRRPLDRGASWVVGCLLAFIFAQLRVGTCRLTLTAPWLRAHVIFRHEVFRHRSGVVPLPLGKARCACPYLKYITRNIFATYWLYYRF